MSEIEYECDMCGRDLDTDQVPEGCGICQGKAHAQKREFTLSSHRAGRAPVANRYGEDGGLAPGTSPLVVGGTIRRPGS